MQTLFPVTHNLIHLNHAAVGPWPQVTTNAVNAFAEENAQYGSLNYPRWMETEKHLRGNLANLINAASIDEIALVKNTSEGLSFVAYGLQWNHGDNVVGIEQEFPSNRFVWDSLSNQGVEFRKLDLEQVEDPEQALMSLCDKHTRLIAISAVQFASGLRMDLKRIGQFCRDNNILFCVDAIQQIGALEFDVQAIKADFAIADGHKWMLAAEGLGLFYVRKEVMPQLQVLQYGWHMAEELGDYTQQGFDIAHSARRFECGSPNMLGIHAMHASIGLLLNTGMNKVEQKVLENTRYLMQNLKSIKGVRLITDETEGRASGIVTFDCASIAADDLYRQLMQHKILCASRGGGVRLSPHYYTPRNQIDQALSIIEDLSQQG